MKQNSKGVDFLLCYWGMKGESLLGNMLSGKIMVATRQRQGLVREGDWVVRAGNRLIRAGDVSATLNKIFNSASSFDKF